MPQIFLKPTVGGSHGPYDLADGAELSIDIPGKWIGFRMVAAAGYPERGRCAMVLKNGPVLVRSVTRDLHGDEFQDRFMGMDSRGSYQLTLRLLDMPAPGEAVPATITEDPPAEAHDAA